MVKCFRYIVGDASGKITKGKVCTLINGLGKSYGGHSYTDLRGNARGYTQHGVSFLIAQRPEQACAIGEGQSYLFALFSDDVDLGEVHEQFTETIYIDPNVDQWFDIYLKIDPTGRWDHLNVYFEDGRKLHFSPVKYEQTYQAKVEEVEEILLTDPVTVVEDEPAEEFEENKILEENEEVEDVVNTGEE